MPLVVLPLHCFYVVANILNLLVKLNQLFGSHCVAPLIVCTRDDRSRKDGAGSICGPPQSSRLFECAFGRYTYTAACPPTSAAPSCGAACTFWRSSLVQVPSLMKSAYLLAV